MAFLHSQMRHHDKNIYYIHNKEIQEFLVKMKMLFLRSLEVFISSREINLCRMDTFPTMVANSQLCATGYRLLDYFWTTLYAVITETYLFSNFDKLWLYNCFMPI